MATILRKQTTGEMVTPTTMLGIGGEARVYACNRGVAKIFFRHNSKRFEVLRWMIANPPGIPALIWPTEILIREDGLEVGYLMPLAPGRCLQEVSDLKKRLAAGIECTWKQLFAIGARLGCLVDEVHGRGLNINDLKRPNIFVCGRSVSFIDTSSFQVPGPGGIPLTNPIASSGYIEPESIGKDLSDVVRDKYYDRFSLAVVIYETIFMSTPWVGGGDLDDLVSSGPWTGVATTLPNYALSPEVIHPRLYELFDRAFSSPLRQHRPSGTKWASTIKEASDDLVQCSHTRTHFHWRGRECHWCRLRTERVDYFPGPRTPVPHNTVVLDRPNQEPHSSRWDRFRAWSRNAWEWCVDIWYEALHILEAPHR